MGLIFRLLGLAGLLFTLLLLSAVAAAGYVLFAGAGTPPDCAPGRPGALGRATQSIAFDTKMAAFVAGGGRRPESAGFDEEEVSARAATYLEGRTQRISDVRLCFEGGGALGFVRVKTLLGREIGIEAKGAMDLKGGHPRLDLRAAKVAGIRLPGFMLRPVETSINDELSPVELEFPLSVSFEQDQVTVTRVR